MRAMHRTIEGLRRIGIGRKRESQGDTGRPTSPAVETRPSGVEANGRAATMGTIRNAIASKNSDDLHGDGDCECEYDDEGGADPAALHALG